jgi:3'-phosphoadenosine 5'-phosphosulfate sulfotransferase (PAPS reductase)/FAD synthetase
MPEKPHRLEQIVTRAADELADAFPDDVLRWAMATFGDRICVTSSMTDAAIVHMASAIRPGIDVVFLDAPRSGRWAGTGKTECGIHL